MIDVVKKEKNVLNENELLSLPDDFIENLTIKQVISPINADISLFVLQHFDMTWYKSDAYKKVHKFCFSYWKKYQELPKISLIEKVFQDEAYIQYALEVKDMLKAISEIKEYEYNAKFLQDAIIKHLKERALYFALVKNINTIETHGDIKQFLPVFENVIKLELNDDIGIEYFDNLDMHIKKLLSPDIVVPTGLTKLDEVLSGGIPLDDMCLFLFMAKPGLGKSMFMTAIARNLILQNKNVLVISLEMSEYLYSKRFDAIFSDIDINELKDATDGLSKRVKAIHLSCPKSKLRIKSFPTGTCTTAHIKQYIKKLKETCNFIPDAIVVDYLNITKPNNSTDSQNLYTKGKAVAEELRALSAEMKEICGKCVPVFSAVQCNRGGAGTGYATDDIDIENSAESSGIPATADVYIAIFQKDGDRAQGKINIKVIKNRYGGQVGRIIPFSVNYQTLRIEDWDDSQENIDVNTLLSGQKSKATTNIVKKEKPIENTLNELLKEN